TSTTYYSKTPSCAIIRRGAKERLVVAFHYYTSTPPVPGNGDIAAQVFDCTTEPVGFPIDTIFVSSQTYEDEKPSVALNGNDMSGLVVWDHAYGGTSDLDILGQRIDCVNADFTINPTSGLVTTESGGTASFT